MQQVEGEEDQALGLPLHGVPQLTERGHAAGERWAQLEKQLGPSKFHKYELIDRWLTEVAIAKVPESRPELYKPTIALADLLKSSPLDAISYPSVVTEFAGMNLCIMPSVVDDLFQPDEAWVFEFDDYFAHPEFPENLLQFGPSRDHNPSAPMARLFGALLATG